MTYADYSAMVEGHSMHEQNTLALQRYYISLILNTQYTKKIAPEDIIYLSNFDQNRADKANEMVQRLFAKELKRKKHVGNA